jgi:hypothetical protein
MILRIGIACDPGGAMGWRSACIDRLLAVPGVELALLVEARRRDRTAAFTRLSRRAAVERVSLPGAQLLPDDRRVQARIEGGGEGCLLLTAEQIGEVREANLDVIVHLADALPAAGLGAAARFGAPFEHGGEIYRPSQDCSETYGGAVRVDRIARLTPDDYEEETVAVLRPDAKGPYPSGLHTLSALGEWTLIDGKRCRWRLPWQPRGFADPDQAALRQTLDLLRADAPGPAADGVAPAPPGPPAGGAQR